MPAGIISIPNHNDLVGLKAKKEEIKLDITNVYANLESAGALPYYTKAEIDGLLSNIMNQLTIINSTLNDMDARIDILENP